MRNLARHILVVVLLLAGTLSLHAQYDKDVFSMRGRLALSDGKFAQAIEHFNVLARLDTTDHMTFFYRGIAKYNLGDLRGAQKDFNTAVRLNPVFTSGYHYRAITESRVGHYDDALADLQKAIELRPGIEGLYFSRGVTYFLSQQFDKAVEDFNHYIRKQPKDPTAYLNRGASYLYLGDTLKALNDYNKAIRLDRFDPEGYVRRGRLHAQRNDYKSAIADMDRAIELDTSNTFAYFNRALMLYEEHDYNRAMADLNRVLRDEPGNALTLYNRGLISAQVGDFNAALSDLDRVLNINPENVLAYFNRASIFIELGRYEDALEDYDKAIELYPDFAKAYMNRSYVQGLLGHMSASKEDYKTAQRKVQEYRAKNMTDAGSFADTTKKYSSLLALDAEFAKKDFDDELLQHRDIDVRLRPMCRFVLAGKRDETKYALSRRYENPLLDRFVREAQAPVAISGADSSYTVSAAVDDPFILALGESAQNRFSMALRYYDQAVDSESEAPYAHLYKAFYLMNRGALRAQMIDFLATLENNVQTLSMDDNGKARARVREQATQQYDYSEAVADLEAAAAIVGDIPYIYYDLGNLYCLSSEHIKSIDSYTKAIALYPYMADAYFNRGLVLIYLKDKEKGCIDLSRAGELGVTDAYGVISKYCEEDKQ